MKPAERRIAIRVAPVERKEHQAATRHYRQLPLCSDPILSCDEASLSLIRAYLTVFVSIRPLSSQAIKIEPSGSVVSAAKAPEVDKDCGAFSPGS